MKVYVVTAYRHGNMESHSYTVGVYSTLSLAARAVVLEQHASNKYESVINEVVLDLFDVSKEELYDRMYIPEVLDTQVEFEVKKYLGSKEDH